MRLRGGLDGHRLRFAATVDHMVSIGARGRTRGRALVSYLAEPVGLRAGSRSLRGHTNAWECREFAHSLAELGLAVDAIDFTDRDFSPSERYDVVLGLHSELAELAAQTEAPTALIHHTGAYPSFQNAAELRRIDALKSRRGIRCQPRRQVEQGPAYDQSLRAASAASLLGNEWTRSSYPPEHRAKVTCLPATGSTLARVRRQRDLVPRQREFIWFFGSGAVHKGLDRALEAFARTPELVLHVVGNIGDEQDFIDAYRRELLGLPNIHWYGFLDPSSWRFRRLVRSCFCVVAPTCSEGTSPATVTMLQLGLYPLISRESGITLPDGAGRYLETCEVEEIHAAAGELSEMAESELAEQTRATQAMALERHSRAAFSRAVRTYLGKATGLQ
jgi:glycosyltransferase involved in cell wall biosynthesis